MFKESFGQPGEGGEFGGPENEGDFKPEIEPEPEFHPDSLGTPDGNAIREIVQRLIKEENRG